MFKIFIYLGIFLSLGYAQEQYRVYEEVKDDFPITYVKIKGIEDLIELRIGVGTPRVLNIQTLSKEIKLLNCFGGDEGTSTLVGYYYTYILDFRLKKVIGLFEYHDDYEQYTPIDKTPQWSLNKNSIVVFQYSNGMESYQKTEFEISNIFEISEAERSFQKMFNRLKKSANNKSPFKFYYSISPSFSIERDFGGIFVSGDLPVSNFSRALSLSSKNNSAWEELQGFFNTNIYIKKYKNLRCLPQNGKYFNNMIYDQLLCFKKIKSNHSSRWVIESLIQAGD